ncbi:hypothetical protein OAH97_00380 [Octadecabacter sp.]|nr:hypothetical protein [Octadecabacter sp.]
MKKIDSGKTTSWTVPGQGLATVRDERSFLNKSGRKLARKSTQVRRNPLRFLMAMGVGAVSVIAARWIDFTYLDTALAFAAEKGVNTASIVGSVPTALSLAILISIMAMFVLGLRSRQTVPLQATGFLGAFLFEADLVAIAPDLYALFYPESWIANMVASATLII